LNGFALNKCSNITIKLINFLKSFPKNNTNNIFIEKLVIGIKIDMKVNCFFRSSYTLALL
jgi:hypothetical protein